MKLKNISILLIISLLFIYSCETDFDTAADWEDITVVYGLLDQKEATQFIKINKAFLGEGNALIYAQEPDSINYPNPLSVKIEEWNETGSGIVRVIEFDTTTAYPREAGVFYYPDQVIYKSKEYSYFSLKYIIQPPNDTISIDTIWLNPANQYKLKITYPDESKTITSETKMVEGFYITKPGLIQTIKFVNDPNATTTFEWEEAENAARYELVVRFNYGELEVGSSDTLMKSIDLISIKALPGNLGEITYIYPSQNFYTSCVNQIPYSDPAVEGSIAGRFSGTVDIYVAAAEEELHNYLQVYEPSTSIVQEKPQYTNIENGIGIFSARHKEFTSKRLHAETVSELENLGLNFIY
jgi:hypothetical protein